VQRSLVERARQGDHEAFSALAALCISRLYGVARLILRDEELAQDAVQDALVTAWEHIRTVRDPDAWDAWLHRLLVRACYRASREARRRRVVELHVIHEPSGGAGGDFTSILAERERLASALGELPIEQRAVVVLHFLLDLPLTEAAEILDIPPGTAKSRLHRGLEAMRGVLAREAVASPLVREQLR
jgi:RNA polymerase sigma-70 factor, ECF subfamily